MTLENIFMIVTGDSTFSKFQNIFNDLEKLVDLISAPPSGLTFELLSNEHKILKVVPPNKIVTTDSDEVVKNNLN